MDFHNKLVKKPWGEEYLLYENESVALWHLKIKEGQETSLHSHPGKKTGLVVLKGAAVVSFLSGENRLFPAEKIIIRQGVFHRTRAVVGDVELLEIETPKDKLDIVRLEDSYGRAGQPYEDSSKYSEYLPIELSNCDFELGRCLGVLEYLYPSKLSINIPTKKLNYVYIILEGQIKSDNFVVAGPGDVAYGHNLKLMFEKFVPDERLLVLVINNP